MIEFDFDLKKVIQIVNYLLKKNNGQMNYTKLIKILYIADKECLKQAEYTITGDVYQSMYNGPVLSNIYDYVKGNKDENSQRYWDTFFSKIRYDLKLVRDNNLEHDLLNKREKRILDIIMDEYELKNYQELIEITHNKDLFPEVRWDKVGYSTSSIKIEDIFKSLGKTSEQIKEIEKELQEHKKDKDFFKNCYA
jgi:uncharacterized phage-associated protein